MIYVGTAFNQEIDKKLVSASDKDKNKDPKAGLEDVAGLLKADDSAAPAEPVESAVRLASEDRPAHALLKNAGNGLAGSRRLVEDKGWLERTVHSSNGASPTV